MKYKEVSMNEKYWMYVSLGVLEEYHSLSNKSRCILFRSYEIY